LFTARKRGSASGTKSRCRHLAGGIEQKHPLVHRVQHCNTPVRGDGQRLRTAGEALTGCANPTSPWPSPQAGWPAMTLQTGDRRVDGIGRREKLSSLARRPVRRSDGPCRAPSGARSLQSKQRGRWWSLPRPPGPVGRGGLSAEDEAGHEQSAGGQRAQAEGRHQAKRRRQPAARRKGAASGARPPPPRVLVPARREGGRDLIMVSSFASVSG